MNNKKYLIVSDLDGTLLNSEGKLTPKTIKTVNNIVKKGHIFCIATGRSQEGSIDIYKQLGLNSLIINHNGSYIYNPSDENFSPVELVFSKDIVVKILENEKVQKTITNAYMKVRGKKHRILNYQLNDYKCDELRNDLIKYYHIDIYNDEFTYLHNNPKNLDSDVYVVSLYLKEDNPDLFDKLIYHIKNISPYLQVRMIKLPTEGLMVEINTHFADKSMGVNFLASYYGIPKDRIVAFGDGDNDMRMLSEAKYGFAMKNGRNTAKMSARHITKYSNNDDGVAWDLEYFMNNIEEIS